MTWDEIRAVYPEQWLVIEALAAHTQTNHVRCLDNIVVLEQCQGGSEALTRYQKLHHDNPRRELYFVHTGRAELEIREQQWIGIRGTYAASNQT